MLNYAFLSVPLGWHTLRHYLYCVVVQWFSCIFCFDLYRVIVFHRFFNIYFAFTSFFFTYFYKIPFFKHRDERDGQVETYGIDPWMKFPKSMRHDVKLRNEAERSWWS